MKTRLNQMKSTLINNPACQRAAIAGALASMQLSQLATNAVFAASGPNIQGGIKQMVTYVSGAVSGVGIIYAIIAIFSWVSALKQDEPERASKAIVNVVIAVFLCLVGPITALILKGFGVSNASSYGVK